jgi:hypothetical protein
MTDRQGRQDGRHGRQGRQAGRQAGIRSNGRQAGKQRERLKAGRPDRSQAGEGPGTVPGPPSTPTIPVGKRVGFFKKFWKFFLKLIFIDQCFLGVLEILKIGRIVILGRIEALNTPF